MPVTLVMAVYKFDRMEWAIEKATELGVAAIAAGDCATDGEASCPGGGEAGGALAAHRARGGAAVAAIRCADDSRSGFSGRARAGSLPGNAHRARRAGALHHAAKCAGGIVAAAQAEMPTLEIAIGPEGGWAPEEEALFDANGWRAVSLGPRILRAETAAITALAVAASFLE